MLYAALLLVPLTSLVLFQAPPRDLPWIVLACWLAFGGARAGTAILGPEFGRRRRRLAARRGRQPL